MAVWLGRVPEREVKRRPLRAQEARRLSAEERRLPALPHHAASASGVCAEGACDHCKSTFSRDPASSPGFDALTAAAHNSRHAAPRSLAGTPPRAGCAAAARSSPLWWPCHNISSRMAHGVCLLTPLRPAAGDRAGAGAAHQAAMLSLLNYDPRRHSPGPKAAEVLCVPRSRALSDLFRTIRSSDTAIGVGAY